MVDLSESFMRFVNKLVVIPLTIREKILLKNKDLIMVSNNCWGYSIYHTLQRSYNTPFVGLSIPPDSYVALLKNFPNCLNDRLVFINSDKTYPVAYLGNAKIEIHFMHYKSVSEAEDKWSRRVARLFDALERRADIFFKFCDSDDCHPYHLDTFHDLPFKHKVSFTVKEYEHGNNIYVPFLKDDKTQSIVNGLQLYKNRYRCFDFMDWILTGDIVPFSITGK